MLKLFRILRAILAPLFVAVVAFATSLEIVQTQRYQNVVDGTYTASVRYDYNVMFSDSSVAADNRAFVIGERTDRAWTAEELAAISFTRPDSTIIADINSAKGQE